MGIAPEKFDQMFPYRECQPCPTASTRRGSAIIRLLTQRVCRILLDLTDFVMDLDLRVVQAGPGLQKLVPRLAQQGVSAKDVFQVRVSWCAGPGKETVWNCA